MVFDGMVLPVCKQGYLIVLQQLVVSVQDIFQNAVIKFEKVLKKSRKTKNWYTKDVLKTSSRHTLKTSWRPTEYLLGRIICLYLANLNLHLANLYLANTYLLIKKKFVAQETIDLNISRPCNFFEKYFITLPINFSFLFKALLWQYFRVVLTVIFKFQITKEVNFDNNIQNIF